MSDKRGESEEIEQRGECEGGKKRMVEDDVGESR
jgi:hypothetical protein